MPIKKKNYRLHPCTVYWRRRGEWTALGQRDYRYPLAADEFFRAWPALLEKRQQSAIQHPEHPNDGRDHAGGFVAVVVQNSSITPK